MKALITGGAGFIGANMATRLQPSMEVIVLDDFSTGSRTNLRNFEGEVIVGDVRDVDTLLGNRTVDVVFHLAAITDPTVMDQSLMFGVNVNGFRSVLEFATRHGAKVVYASSASVYGDGPVPMTETQTPRPLNPYAESKLNMEQVAVEYREKKQLRVVGLRYFNAYGPLEHHKGKVASMIWQLALQMVQGRSPRIFKWGEQKRDQTYVEDVVAANILAMERAEEGVFNVGTGHPVSYNEIVRVLNDALSYSYQPEYVDNPYGFFQSITQAEMLNTSNSLGFEARYDLISGVKAYFERTDPRNPYSLK